jgi:hypothetical protein
MCAADWVPTRARALRSALSVVLATLAAGCAIPLLERDSSYPAGWPSIAGPMADCSGISGTFANKGVYVDKAGDTQEIWLTNLLPLSERTPPGDPRHKERAALRSCERVTLRFVLDPLPDRPSVKTPRLIVSPARLVGAGPSGRWEPCSGFQLPLGRGWPFEGSLFAGCTPNSNFFVLATDLGQIVPDVFHLSLGLGTDGSLIARWEYGPTWSIDHVWARFDRLP